MDEKTTEVVVKATNALEQALGHKANTTTAIVLCFGVTIVALLISKAMDNGYDAVLDSSGKVIKFTK